MAGKRKRRPAWTQAHVRRLFWRAGFGATPSELAKWVKRGRADTIDWIVNGDGAAQLRGPGPTVGGKPIDRENEYGHDVVWWLDRMVRTTRPLEERMTLFWHGHFACRDVDTPLMLAQNETLRKHALGSFDALLRDITLDPAMQLFLSLAYSHKDAPNENYARELMELFTIGTGYTEADVLEASRALTGFMAIVENGRVRGIRYDPARHDDGPKTIFGKSGAFGWEDALRLCVEHPRHAEFLVEKLWAHFIPTPILPRTRTKLAALYMREDRKIKPLVARILDHPHLYADLNKPSQVKSPVVWLVGMLRAIEMPLDRASWVFLLGGMGQLPFRPPSVAGWQIAPDGGGWMSSNAMRTRFVAVNELTRPPGRLAVPPGSVKPDLSPNEQVDSARTACGDPWLSGPTIKALLRHATARAADTTVPATDKAQRTHAEMTQRALRQLIAAAPDNQLC